MIKHDRRDSSNGYSAFVDTYTIDFAEVSNLSRQLTIGLMPMRTVSVEFNQLNCTGISGSYTLKQSTEDSGSHNYDLVEGALTVAAAVNATVAIVKGTLTMEYLVIDMPATLPTSGTLKIVVTSKIN
jgi:hypothetical protein